MDQEYTDFIESLTDAGEYRGDAEAIAALWHDEHRPTDADDVASLVEYHRDMYRGWYGDPAELVEEILTDAYGISLPHWLVVDLESTWERNLRHDFRVVEGHIWHVG